MNTRQSIMTIVGVATIIAGSAFDAGTTEYDTTLRPIHWWIGGRHDRAQTETADLVTSWTVKYSGAYKVGDEERRLRREVGGVVSIDAAIQGLKDNYAQGARILATDHENWSRKTTLDEAKAFVSTIDSQAGLTVVQWNSWLTWVADARPVIEDHPRLLLMEMIYPTCENKRTYDEVYNWIMSYVKGYSDGKKPGIGLSVYTGHDMKTPVSWELMMTQIDAAKAAGKAIGSDRHPIGIFIANVEPTEFTVDDVNNYIIYGTRSPETRTMATGPKIVPVRSPENP